MDKRILELETKFSYMEKFVDELNEVVIEQQKQIVSHKKLINQLNEIIKENQSTDSSAPANEKPPHY